MQGCLGGVTKHAHPQVVTRTGGMGPSPLENQRCGKYDAPNPMRRGFTVASHASRKIRTFCHARQWAETWRRLDQTGRWDDQTRVGGCIWNFFEATPGFCRAELHDGVICWLPGSPVSAPAGVAQRQGKAACLQYLETKGNLVICSPIRGRSCFLLTRPNTRHSLSPFSSFHVGYSVHLRSYAAKLPTGSTSLGQLPPP